MNQCARSVISRTGCGQKVVNSFVFVDGIVKVQLIYLGYCLVMLIVAHRGLHAAAPENSRAALVHAIEAGLAHLEVDVRATADGELVLMHDRTLWRTTSGRGELRTFEAHELRGIRIADGSPIPTLREVLQLCRDRATLCIDVKEPELGTAIIDLVREVGATVQLWSEHTEVIACAADRGVFAAWISNGMLPEGGSDALAAEALQLGARAVSFYPADVVTETARSCRDAGLMLMSGTPNDRLSWENLRRLGVGCLITDRPIACREWLTLSLASTPTEGPASTAP